MPSFSPPTVQQSMPGDRFWSRYSVPVGQSVVKIDGTYALHPVPWIGDLVGLTEGTDYFLGGRTYVITDEIAAALDADGFTTTSDPGYGDGDFGDEEYGS
jgi:hypothetical protein